MIDAESARCAVHPERPAPIACWRCGAFTCEACTPSPSIVCPVCAARVGPDDPKGDWSGVPPASLVERLRVMGPLYGSLIFLAAVPVSRVWPTSYVPAAMSCVAIVVFLGTAMSLLRHRAQTRALPEAVRSFDAGRVKDAAIVLEGMLRSRSGLAGLRIAAFQQLGWMLTYGGEHGRAIELAERVIAVRWSPLVTSNAHRIAAHAHAARGAIEAAETHRREMRLGWLRLVATTADTNGLVAARSRRWADAHAQFDAFVRHPVGGRNLHVRRWTRLVDAFALASAGAPEASVETALAIGRDTPAETIAGLTRDWPELAAFVARRLPSAEPAPEPRDG